MRIRVINGPNLDQLGQREPDIYGNQTYEMLCHQLHTKAQSHGVALEIFQSHYEGQLIEWILDQDAYDALIINPAAYSHYSIALLDALKMVKKEVIEVHLTNIHQREAFRQTSVTAIGVRGVVAGFGFDSYLLAMDYLISHANILY